MRNLCTYLVKAIDNYPYNMEECWESLQYALSSDDGNPLALCLMGRIYSEQYRQYEKAKEYFEEAMAQDMNLPEIYPHYIYALVVNGDYQEAKKVIDFAYSIKGIDKGNLSINRIIIAEKRRKYNRALKLIDEGIYEGYNNEYIRFLEQTKSRVKKKMKLRKKNKKIKKKSK